MARAVQAELDFAAGMKPADGIASWRAELSRQRELLAKELGLPLDKEVEVWLVGGVRLRGQLKLEDALLLHANSTLQNTRFEVAGVPFSYAEIESCGRI
jgi:hypothetical protein